MNKYAYILILLILQPLCLFSQISGVINSYARVIDIDYTCNKISVNSTSGFNQGDTVMLIQMKGAVIESANSSSFGNITSIANAGNYELAQIYGISGSDIYLKHGLLKMYTTSGAVQLVSVPVYQDVTVTGTLTAKAWDGETGGVLAMDVRGTLSLQADVNVSALGFRGGKVNSVQGTSCFVTDYCGASNSNILAGKGEGIAEFIASKEAGRGKQANGGGGGNSNNFGGSGGGNYNAGGIGGGSSACFIATQGQGGISLRTYLTTNNKLFLGGGGGAGHQNNYTAPGPPSRPGGTNGGNGGGIIVIKAQTLEGNGRQIVASGQSMDTPAYGDGAGGGGAGGTIVMDVSTYTGSVTVDVQGGKGDDVYDGTGRDLGTGGGGSGGMIALTSASIPSGISAITNGGVAGTVNVCNCVNGATAGGVGSTLTNYVVQQSTTLFTPPCISLPVSISEFNAVEKNGTVVLNWTTEQEKDNAYFLIERSSDMLLFEHLSKVAGKGTSLHANQYVAYDLNPYVGVNYYRLIQVDKDGKNYVMGTIAISNEDETKVTISPNPFESEIRVSTNIVSVLQEVLIKNTLGEVVTQIKDCGGKDWVIDGKHLLPGIYLLVVKAGDSISVFKIIRLD